MATDAFCSVDTQDWVIKGCGIEKAGIIAVGIIDIDENPSRANLESLAYWTGRLAASPQNFYLVQPTRGEYPGGTPTEEEGFGTDATQITGADHTVNFEAPGLIDNSVFWEFVNRKRWKVAFFTNAGFIYYETNPVTIYATIMNAKSPKASAFWKVVAKWQDYSNPQIYNTPSGLLTAV